MAWKKVPIDDPESEALRCTYTKQTRNSTTIPGASKNEHWLKEFVRVKCLQTNLA